MKSRNQTTYQPILFPTLKIGGKSLGMITVQVIYFLSILINNSCQLAMSILKFQEDWELAKAEKLNNADFQHKHL